MSQGSISTGSLRFQRLRKREGFLARAALVLFLFVGAAIFFVWTRSQVIELGLEMSELKRIEKQALRHKQMLTVERSTLRSVERIEGYALDKLGLVYPDPISIKALENR